jgi:hypothetical protein
MKPLTLCQQSADSYEGYVGNAYIGDFYREIDGFWVYNPSKGGGGYFDAPFLRILADKLDELNEPWNKHLEEFFREA